MQRVNKCYQKACIKLDVDMNTTELRKKQKHDFEKDFWSWWTMQFFEKPWKMCKENRDIKLRTTKTRSNYLVSGP